jgi:hypothetical protein
MDPYLEGFWNDVHGKLLAYLADVLNEMLPPNYRATMNTRVVMDDFNDAIKLVSREPDVAVVDWPVTGPPAGTALATHSHQYLFQSPQFVRFEPEPVTEYFLEITESRFGSDVITAIELLSPTNKRPGDGMNQFKKKQVQYRTGQVNRVEIDLLRHGTRIFDFPAQSLDRTQLKPYYIAVYWGDRANVAGIHAIDLRDPLPVIGIPLRPGEPEVPVALQPLLDRVYRNGRFPIDYRVPLDPPLTGEDAVWAAELIAKGAG